MKKLGFVFLYFFKVETNLKKLTVIILKGTTIKIARVNLLMYYENWSFGINIKENNLKAQKNSAGLLSFSRQLIVYALTSIHVYYHRTTIITTTTATVAAAATVTLMAVPCYRWTSV